MTNVNVTEEIIVTEATKGIELNEDIVRLTAELDRIKQLLRAYGAEKTENYSQVGISTDKGTVSIAFPRPKTSVNQSKANALKAKLSPVQWEALFEEKEVVKVTKEVVLRENYQEILNTLNQGDRFFVEEAVETKIPTPMVYFPKVVV